MQTGWRLPSCEVPKTRFLRSDCLLSAPVIPFLRNPGLSIPADHRYFYNGADSAMWMLQVQNRCSPLVSSIRRCVCIHTLLLHNSISHNDDIHIRKESLPYPRTSDVPHPPKAKTAVFLRLLFLRHPVCNALQTACHPRWSDCRRRYAPVQVHIPFSEYSDSSLHSDPEVPTSDRHWYSQIRSFLPDKNSLWTDCTCGYVLKALTPPDLRTAAPGLNDWSLLFGKSAVFLPSVSPDCIQS